MLPKFQEVQSHSPKRVFLFSHTKVGKTTLISGLPNTLIIDTEGGSSYISGIKADIKRIANQVNIPEYKVMEGLAAEIEKEKAVYDFIVLDTVTGLEEIAHELAVKMYKESVTGKNYKGTDVCSDLAQGAGYGWLRKAFEQLLSLFDHKAKYGLILTGHIKLGSISKDGKEIGVKDVHLTGKLKQMICASSDAIGFLYRSKDNINQTIVSFKTNEEDLVSGARPDYLRNQEFIIADCDKNGKFKFYWDRIYLELAPNKVAAKSMNSEPIIKQDVSVLPQEDDFEKRVPKDTVLPKESDSLFPERDIEPTDDDIFNTIQELCTCETKTQIEALYKAVMAKNPKLFAATKTNFSQRKKELGIK